LPESFLKKLTVPQPVNKHSFNNNNNNNIIIIIIIIIIIEFLTSQVYLGNIHLTCDSVINTIRLGGLSYGLESFLQLNMGQELQTIAFVYMYLDAG
jgi:hypothetical protein